MSGPVRSGPFTWIRNQDLLQAGLKVQSPTRNKRKSRRPKAKNKFQNKTMSPSEAAGPHVMSRKLGWVGPCAGGLGLASSPPQSANQTKRRKGRGHERRGPRATMPGLTAPSNYEEEPPRHPALQINSKVTPHLSRQCFSVRGSWGWVWGLAMSPLIARIRSFSG
jgi:hypothetical protein